MGCISTPSYARKGLAVGVVMNKIWYVSERLDRLSASRTAKSKWCRISVTRVVHYQPMIMIGQLSPGIYARHGYAGL
jgi:hypothetical protein